MSKKNAPLLIGSHEGRQGRVQVGTLRIRKDGNGSIRPLAGPPDLFVPRDEAEKALDGDMVRFEVVPVHGRSRGDAEIPDVFRGRDTARVIEVLEQRRQLAIGVLDKQRGQPMVVPRDRRLLPIPVKNASRFRQGAFVKASVGLSGTCGSVLEQMDPSASKVTELEAAYAQGFSDVFPSAALKAAQGFPAAIGDDQRAGRTDLTWLPLVTIDGADARDFDDAVYGERLEGGAYRLVVAIADVAHYVRRDGPIDQEALRRGTSVYFPALVLPMLPVRLSNGLCSLNPGEDRLAIAVDMKFVPDGDGFRMEGEAAITEAVIRSAARCTYEEVEDFCLTGKTRRPLGVADSLSAMKELAQGLIRSRRRRGAIDLEIPATQVVLDDSGHPLRIDLAPRLFSHRLVEEFMLAANEAVAQWFQARDLPTVYRVHDRPDALKLSQCLEVVQVHAPEACAGFHLDVSRKRADVSCRKLADLVDSLKGLPAEKALNFMVLRSMAQAFYSPDNMGHFGLASDAYLHFTSPIRRYPDLEVHRQLKDALARARDGKKPRKGASLQKLEGLLDAIAGRSSERERAAMAAERDVQSWAAAAVASQHAGETFQGVVISVTDFGVFVQMDGLNAEGLLLPERMGKAWVDLDPDHQRATIGKGRTLTLGSRVSVRLDSVDVEKRHVDLSLVG